MRIALAVVLWGLILWLMTIGMPGLAPLAVAIFMVAVLPTGIVEWLNYRGRISDERSGPAKIVLMIIAALAWYLL